MNKDCCGIWDKFQSDQNLIKEYKHWILVIRPKQAKLGACVAITKRHVPKMSDLTPNEMKEYSAICRDIEPALNNTFHYESIHHMVMMFKDKHIHFHIFPRYNRTINCARKKWSDDFKPDPFLQKVDPSPQETLNIIRDKIIKNLPENHGKTT